MEEFDIRYRVKPRGIAVKGRLERKEIKEGDRVSS
jgi:hypothetical protein